MHLVTGQGLTGGLGWSAESPGLQAETPGAAAAEAGGRKADVYMGIDVFGRGTYGGGKLNTHVAAAAAICEGALLRRPAQAADSHAGFLIMQLVSQIQVQDALPIHCHMLEGKRPFCLQHRLIQHYRMLQLY